MKSISLITLIFSIITSLTITAKTQKSPDPIEHSEFIIHTRTSEGEKLDFNISIVFKKVSKSYKNDFISSVKKCVKEVVLNTSINDIESIDMKIREELINKGIEFFHVTCELTPCSEFLLTRMILLRH
jgi:hypothetical protein